MDYNLGRNTGSGPQKFEDLDEGTRRKIADTFIEIARQRQSLIDTLEPAFDSMRKSLAPIVDIAQTLVQLAERMKWFVPNWPSDLDVELAWQVAHEGVPIAFVPAPRLVSALVDAESHDERLRLLARSRSAIVADCRQALEPEWDAPFPVPATISMLPPLIREAIDALEAGYAAAACALGACIVDSLIRRTVEDFKTYPAFRNSLRRSALTDAAAMSRLRVELAWLPVYHLLEEWSPKNPNPQPTMPSRHVVAHWPTPEHLSELNALIIVMAVTSLFLGLCESEQRKALIDRSP